MTREQFSTKKSFFAMYERGKTVLAGATYQKNLNLGDYDYIRGFSLDFTGNVNCQTTILFNNQGAYYQLTGFTSTSNNTSIIADSAKISIGADPTVIQFQNKDTADHILNWGIFCK